jgi:hypothetical protein
MMIYSTTLSCVTLSVLTHHRRAWRAGIAALALGAAGCTSTAHPPHGRGQVDSPITTKNNRLNCLRKQHLPVQEVGANTLQIGALPSGPTVQFKATAGIAQGLIIQGVPSAQGAETIGGSLLYPNGASDGELKKIETCLSQGVSG